MANNQLINEHLSNEAKIDLYTQMVRIRRFEERCVRAYQQGHIGGFCHTYIGEEAVAVGSISVLGPNDHIISAYRIHGQALAIGMPMNTLMAEMFGKVTGCSQGKGGSMHFMAPERHFWGGHGIVGGQTPLGAGLAFALKYQGKRGACLCYLGDGAINQGVFYEALNLAGLWSLPVIYIIENNGYSMGTSQKRGCAGTSLARRAEPFGIHWDQVDGNDLYAVRVKVSELLEKAYKQTLPSVLEVFTYRYRGHSMSDPDQTYRTKEEIKEQQTSNDPIERFKTVLLKEGAFDEQAVETIDKKAREEAEASAQFAQNSPFPKPEAIQKHIYWEADNPEYQKSEGRLLFNSLDSSYEKH